MHIHRSKSIGLMSICLLLALITGAGILPPGKASAETGGISPRNVVYGDIQAFEQITGQNSRDISPSDVDPLPQISGVEMNELTSEPNRLYGAVIVHELYSNYTQRTALYKRNAYNVFDTSTLLYDGYTNNYSPDLDSRGEKVVFTSYTDNNADVWVIDYTGAGLRRLTNHAAYDGTPIWSPDNQRIAFVSNRDGNYEIYSMDPDGGNLVRVTSDPVADMHPAWSPDGQTIAWIKVVSETQGQIWMADADGGNPRAFYAPLAYLYDLIWSPDGTYLAFDYDEDLDGWNDAKSLKLDSLILVEMREIGWYWADRIPMAWGPYPGWIYLDTLNYERDDSSGSYYFISSSFECDILESASFCDVSHYSYTTNATNNFGFHLDMAMADSDAPVSTISPLPRYSRVDGLVVRWNTIDAGISRIYSSILYVSDSIGFGWNELFHIIPSGQTSQVSGAYIFNGRGGKTYYLAAQGRDHADNLEYRAPTGSYTTTMYKNDLSGSLVDNRGRALVGQTINLSGAIYSQAVTSGQGEFQTLYPDLGNTELTVESPLWAGRAPVKRNLTGDSQVSLVLQPSANLIQNASFENAQILDQWTAGGEDLPVEAVGNSGNKSIRLGNGCANGLCLAPWQEIGFQSTSFPHVFAMDIDSSDTLHVVWQGQYASRDASGVWSEPRILLDATNEQPRYAALRVDAQDNVHIILTNDSGIYYLMKPRQGEWPGQLEVVSNSTYLANSIGFDLNGSPILYFFSMNNYFTIYRKVNGVWIVREIPNSTGTHYSRNFQTGPDGKVYLARVTTGRMLCLDVITIPAGEEDLIPTETRCTEAAGFSTQPSGTHLDAQGNMQVVLSGYLFTFRADGGSSAPLYLASWDDQTLAEIEDANDGSLWISQNRWSYYPPLVVFVRPAGKAKFHRVEINDNDSYAQFHFKLDSLGRPQIIRLRSTSRNAMFSIQALAPAASSSTIEQQLIIPADLHAPTLSFMYRLFGSGPGLPEAFKVEVVPDGGEAVTVFQSGEPVYDWSHAWADLSGFAGQSVTLRFSINQFPGEPLRSVLLDDISVGAWTTPVIHSIEPVAIPWPVGPERKVILHGDNFIGDMAAPPVVKLDGQAVTVTAVATDTLEILVPEGLAFGAYDLEVTNPGGFTTYAPGALRVGSYVFLPAVRR